LWRGRPRGLRARSRRWLSALTVQILILNGIAAGALIVGVVWVQSARDSLVEERINSLMAQAQIISAALARYAPKGEGDEQDAATEVDERKATELLNLLVGPTGMRARIFGRDGATVQDTRFILARNQVQVKDLPPPGQVDLLDEAERWVNRRIYSMMPGDEPPPFVDDEPRPNGRVFEEVKRVLDQGEQGSGRRINAEGNLIVSVAVPIKRLKYVMGVLMLSTEAGDIDDALRQEWTQLLLGGLLALVVLGVASWFLRSRITEPLRQLAVGADAVRRGGRQAVEAIPDMSRRRDEIGDLSVALRSMTASLYARMDAIESFAADVAHEIKNPLTSVASAIETLERTSDEEKRKKLMAVIRDDVRRLDKLISDISDASRLDAELSRERTHDVELKALIGAMAQMFEDPDDARAPRIVLDMPESPLVVRGLEGAIAQVFRNVIANAVSFSPRGGQIRIAARAQGGRAVITVDDQGPGIPEDNLEVIFRRFYTERPASHGFGKNSGLGLSISRQIVETLGGQIRASNIRDTSGAARGARFTIELPLARV
jgi:two-component system sensor histidine kinase ChvG